MGQNKYLFKRNFYSVNHLQYPVYHGHGRIGANPWKSELKLIIVPGMNLFHMLQNLVQHLHHLFPEQISVSKSLTI